MIQNLTIAQNKILKALKPLTPEQQKRIIEYVADRYGLKPSAAPSLEDEMDRLKTVKASIKKHFSL